MPIDPIFSSRLKAIQDEAQELYYKMSGKKEEIKIELDPKLDLAEASAPTKTIFVNPVFLLERGDIPKLIRKHNLESGKLSLWERLIGLVYSSSKYHSNDPLIRTLVARKFEIDPEKFDSFSSGLVYQNCYWEYPDFAAIKRFVIAHEAAHIFHSHRQGHWSLWCSIFTACLIGLYFFSTLHFFIATSLTLIVSRVVGKGFKCLRHYMERYQENEADLSALSVTKDFKAVEYFFKVTKFIGDKTWAELSWSNRIYDAITSPEIVFRLTHPSPQDRIDYLRENA